MSLYNVLYLLLVFSFALSAVAMWVNWYLNPHELAVRDWAIALSLILVGCALAVIARLQMSDPALMIPLSFTSFLRDLGTAINGLSWMVILVGMRRFLGRPLPSRQLLFAIWVGFFAILLVAHPLEISGAWGVAWISTLVAVCSLMILYEILKPGIGGVATWFACAGFSLAAITWGVRATMSFVDLNRPIDSGFDIGVMFGAVVSAYACMMGMILLTNQRLIDQLGNLANRDPLTGALNRRAFFESVKALISQAKNSDDQCSLVLLDIDNFKDINDKNGHEGGDVALRQVSIASMQVLGRQDLFARYGGDEFVFFLYRKTSVEAKNTMNRLQVLLQQNLVESEKGTFQVRVSMGVSSWQSGMDFSEFIRQADTALYEAKNRGRDQVVIYDNHSVPSHNDGTYRLSS